MSTINYIPISSSNVEAALDIYNYYIENSTATFHLEKISKEMFLSSLPVQHAKYKSYLIMYENHVCGYAYFNQYKNRQAYDRTAEVTIYLHHKKTGSGLAKPALQKLEEEAQKANIKTLIAVISEENQNSVRFFEKNGFQKCGHLHKVGEKFDRVLDVVFMEKEI